MEKTATMNRAPQLPVLCLGLAAALLASPARAANPTAKECLAANEKGLSLRSQHQLRAARDSFLECNAPSCPTDIRNDCAHAVTEINAALPSILFEAKDADGNDVVDVKVTMDGQALVASLQGTSIPLDPGPHTFVFESSGLAPVTKKFVIVEGTKDRRERVTFARATGATPAAVAPAGAPPENAPTASNPTSASESTPPTADSGSEGGSPGGAQRIIGWTLAGAGAVGLGLGVVFMMSRSSKLDERNNVCPSRVDCEPGSQARIDALGDDAKSAGTLGVVGLVAGGALAAGGLVLVFTAPKASQRVAIAPWVAPGFEGISIGGRM